MNAPSVAAGVPTNLPADLGTAIRAEYCEMPGLCLTLAQAARLWNVDADQCQHTLEILVRKGFLRRWGDLYVKAGNRPDE
jgi:hypothetical protein